MRTIYQPLDLIALTAQPKIGSVMLKMTFLLFGIARRLHRGIKLVVKSKVLTKDIVADSDVFGVVEVGLHF